ncbi:hypothetical protein ACIBRY_19060 [Streptomyces anulatus]
MTSRRPRDLEAERAALRAAADRLLAGTPLRSASGKLTASELLRESGLRRDGAYGDHKDLVEEFQARVKAQSATPAAMQELADKYSAVKEKLAAVTENLAKEQVVSAALRRSASAGAAVVSRTAQPCFAAAAPPRCHIS